MPSYSDEDFLKFIPDDPDVGIGTHRIAGYLDCAWNTVNRRLTELAAGDIPITVYDPKTGEEITEQTDTGRLLTFTLDDDAVAEDTDE
jgi:hypothetical protein